jgi:uncharacterized membrane protein YfcA
MPDILAQALAHPGLAWLAAAAGIAGIVRGFSGFGTAMVYMPVAGQILDPFSALVTLTLMDVIGPLPNVPRALRDGHRRDILRLCAGLVIALPAGLWLLGLIEPMHFRYTVSVITLGLLVLLIAGVRYRGILRHWMIYGTGMLGGFLGGLTGLAGPPVIMLYMASAHPPRVIRANLMLYLLGVDMLMVGVLWFMGRLEPSAVVIGLLLALPYLAGNVLGGVLFRPRYEPFYRRVAYAVIAASALSGMPFFD